MENVIEVRGLIKDYKQLRAVDHLDLDLRKGEILGLLGPNGSGKSTTINCILSLLKNNGGNIKILGREMTPTSYDLKEKIGVVFQEVGVFRELTVYENIDYFCSLYIKDKKKRRKNVEETIELLGLENYRKFKPKQLSGGLLRRLNIGCGISHKPEIIFFDEPTVAVDPQSRNKILERIKQLNSQGSSIIYTSHYMEEVEEICDRIIIIDKGKVLATGSLDQLKNMIEAEEKISFEASNLSNSCQEKIKEMDGIIDFSYNKTTCKLSLKKGSSTLLDLVRLLDKEGVKYQSINSQKPSLNDVFLALTGKELRD